MPRSPLFSAVRRILRRARLENGPTLHQRTSHQHGAATRRQFLQTVGALSLVPAIGGCGDNVREDGGASVAIVGAGIAGLTAAHFLEAAGVRTQLFESSMRVGGRMWTQRGLPDGQLVELGGELVDSDHLVIPALARSFGLALDDLVADTEGLRQDIFHFNGAVQGDAAIVTAFQPVAAKMETAVAMGDASSDYFAMVDAMSIPQWLETEAGLAPTSMIRELLEVAYLEEYGLEVAEQSAWNLLYLIDYTTPDPFRVFGDSDERYHFHAGNDALASAIAERLGDRILLDHALEKVEALGNDFALTFATAGGPETVRAQHVVYALPFTRLREVDLSGAELSEEKRTAITELGYGTNAKLMMQFTDRHWEIAQSSGGGVITDVGMLQTVWATSRGQPGTRGILTNFVGGNRGLAIGEGTAEAQAQMVLPWIETVFPNIASKYVADSAIRQHWPSYEHVKGSYACYKVGQWTPFFATEGAREGNQHFCGEHCSEDYQGYMEGGAETGAMVAGEILEDLGVPLPPILAGLLAIIAERPRASYHAGFGKKMTIGQVRRR